MISFPEARLKGPSALPVKLPTESGPAPDEDEAAEATDEDRERDI